MAQETIQIGFTDQKVRGRAGLLTFAGFLHWHRFSELVTKVLPHVKTRGIPAADLALAFLAGILAGAQKLAQVAYQRNDVMLPALLAIRRIGSQSMFALPKRCVKNVWGTEAALSLAILSCNLTQLFHCNLGWVDRVTATTLRFRPFTTGHSQPDRWDDDHSFGRAGPPRTRVVTAPSGENH